MFEKDMVFNILSNYLPLLLGLVAQLVFLLLPVGLKNWRDDALNALTYVSMQMFVSGLIFIAIPRYYELFHLDDQASFMLLCCIFFGTWLRVVLTIPLEGTATTKQAQPPPALVAFTDFYDKGRLLSLAALSEADPYDRYRIILIKERIRKKEVDLSRGKGFPRLQ